MSFFKKQFQSSKFVKFQSVFSNCCIYRYSKSKPKRKEDAVADAGGELLMEVDWRDAPARGVSKVGQRQTLSLAQWNEHYKARKM